MRWFKPYIKLVRGPVFFVHVICCIHMFLDAPILLFRKKSLRISWIRATVLRRAVWKHFTNILKFAVACSPLCMIAFSVLHLQIHKFLQNNKFPQFCFNLRVSVQRERLCVNLSYCSILTRLFVVQLIFFFHKFCQNILFFASNHVFLSFFSKRNDRLRLKLLFHLGLLVHFLANHFFHKLRQKQDHEKEELFSD